MKTSIAGNLRSMGGKILLGLVVASMIGSMDLGTAVAGDHDGRGGHYDGRGGHYDGRRYEGRGHWRGHDRGNGYYRDGRVYRSYGYVEPVYVAPPVYYAPQPAPGISIFLPTIHIR